MKEYPLISVIVPVYKVEEYLDQCIQSIIEQTYQNLEIILVDDGSPDNCGSLCDEWGKRDKRIRVIHKLNGGLSDARNAGILASKGDLVGFVDSDDWIDSKMYQCLYEQMCKTNSDISICGVVRFWEKENVCDVMTMKGNVVLDTASAIRAIVEETWIKQPVWNKLYKKNIISNLFFPVGKWHEDAYWSYQAIAQAKRVCVSDELHYHYRQSNNSIMGRPYSVKRLDFIEAQKQMLTYIRNNYPELIHITSVQVLFSCIYAMEMSMQHISGEEQKFAFNKIRETVKDILPIMPSCKFGIKKNIWILLSQISFDGVCRLQLYLEKKEK